ncbi:MAG: hypothetical protein GY820_35305 [Gammaproteobacteria bacterium]|nr:hypothetical protein [Gammaproteobacteria bacterium]
MVMALLMAWIVILLKRFTSLQNLPVRQQSWCLLKMDRNGNIWMMEVISIPIGVTLDLTQVHGQRVMLS